MSVPAQEFDRQRPSSVELGARTDASDASDASEPLRLDEAQPEPVELEELVVPVLLLAIGAYLTYGLVTMEVPEAAESPGPRFFPVIVTGLIFLVAAISSVKVVVGHVRSRHRRPALPATDWRATGTVVASLLVFAAALVPLGWIVAGALLFWGVARGLGSRRPTFDVLVALSVSSFVQLTFSAGLGLRLPPGIFGWF